MSSDQYVGIINGQMAAFCAVQHFPHATVKNMKRIHRLVVRPDYQGIGIGARVSESIADDYIKRGYRITITTSTPALLAHYKNSKRWRLARQGHSASASASARVKKTASGRITTSWEYIGSRY